MHNCALLDALLALAEVSSGPGYCRPVVVEPASAPDGPFVSIRGCVRGVVECVEGRGSASPDLTDLG